MKQLALFVIPLIMSIPALAESPSPQIDFEIDCMIHDSKGILLAELGTVGRLMDGSYQISNEFAYEDLKVVADLRGPFSSTPEVHTPQLRLSFAKMNNPSAPTAMVTISAIPGMNAALWEPTENLYLHCDQMEM